MSHQPSTIDNIKSGATEAYNVVTSASGGEGLSRKKTANTDDQGQVCKKGSFKDQLNQAAQGSGRTQDDVKEQPGYLEKVASSIPGYATIQQTVFGQGPEISRSDPNVCDNNNAPPKRPDHDIQVEEFLRTQYKSKSGQGMPEVGSSDP